MVNFIKPIAKSILRPFARPIFDRMRLIAREESFSAIHSAKSEDRMRLIAREESFSAIHSAKSEDRYIVKQPYTLVNVELTNSCPMKCVICPRPKKMTREIGFMDFQIFRSIIEQYRTDNPFASDNVVWLHHFGDSLLHPDFDKFITYMSSRGMKPGISINPWLLTSEKAIRLLRAQPAQILIMFDGIDDESFFETRGVLGIFQKSYENTLYFLRISKELSPGTDVAITCVDIPMWKEKCNRIVKFWCERHGIEVQRKQFTVWNGESDYINSLADQIELGKMRDNIDKNVCTSPFSTLSILFNGDVVICCYDYNGFSVIGNVRLERISDIWNSDKIRCLRYQIDSGIVMNRLCITCPYTWKKDVEK